MVFNFYGLLILSSVLPLLTLTESKYCEDQSDYVTGNCRCWIYERTKCNTYYYSNGEGTTYILKNFHWDDVCAACCCEALGTDEPTAAPSAPTPTSYPSNLTAEETCCSNAAVKPKPKLKLKPKLKSKSKKRTKAVTVLANNTVQSIRPALIQESNLTLQLAGTPPPKIASEKTSYAYESNSWISKNHYSLSSKRLWKWNASAVLVVTAIAAVLALVAARFMGRMQQRFKNARIIHSDLQAHGCTTVRDRGDFISPYDRGDSKRFSDTTIVHPNYVPF